MRKIAAEFIADPFNDEARDLDADEWLCRVSILEPSDAPQKHTDRLWSLRIDSAGVEWQMRIPKAVAEAWLAEIKGGVHV